MEQGGIERAQDLSERQRESIEVLLTNRVYLYEMFHTVLGCVPDEELLRRLADASAAEAFDILSQAPDDTMAEMSRFASSLGSTLEEDPAFLEKVQNEYTRLFIGPGRLVAYPWESTYTGEDDLLFQESTLKVREFYRCYGFLPQEYPHVADDHISLELHFMSKLGQKALAAFQAGELQQAREYLDGQREFLDTHMLKWIPQYAENIQQSKTDHLYPRYVAGANAFIAIDKSVIAEIIDWIDRRPA